MALGAGKVRMKFRKKPPLVEAVQYDGKNGDELKALYEDTDEVVFGNDGDILLIQSKRNCLLMLNKGDWLLKDDWGYVCSMGKEEFARQYEQAV